MIAGTSLAPLAGTVVGIFGETSAEKDVKRFAESEQWYAQALAGDRDALCALKYMSGRYGCAPGGCGRLGPRCGYATQPAKDYAHALAQQAEAILAGQVPIGAPMPYRPTGGTSGTAQTLSTVSQVTGSVAAALGAPTPAQQQLAAVLDYGKVFLVVGGVAVLGFLLLRSLSKR